MKNMASGVVNSLNSIHISFKTNEILSGKIKGLSFGRKYKGQWLASYCLLLMKSTGELSLCSLCIRESLKMTKIWSCSCVKCLLNKNHHELENPRDLYKSTILFCSLFLHAVMEAQLRQRLRHISFLYKYNVTRTKEQVMNLRSGGDIKRAEGSNREEI